MPPKPRRWRPSCIREHLSGRISIICRIRQREGKQCEAGRVDDLTNLNGSIHQAFDTLRRSDVDLKGRSLPASGEDLAGDGGNGRVWRVWIWGEGDLLGWITYGLGGDNNYRIRVLSDFIV